MFKIGMLQKFRKGDRSSSAPNRSQPVVKMEYSSASQSDMAQDPYHNQIGNMEHECSSISYIQTQYGMRSTTGWWFD